MKFPMDIHTTCYSFKHKRICSFSFPKGTEVDEVTDEELDSLYPYRNLMVNTVNWKLIIKNKPSTAVWLPIENGDRMVYYCPKYEEKFKNRCQQNL